MIFIRALYYHKVIKVGSLDFWTYKVLEEWTSIIVGTSRVITYITEILEFSFRAVLVNFHLSIRSILLLIGRVFKVM